MQIVEERCGGVFDDIEDVLPADERARIAADYKRLAGFDIDGLNTRGPLVPLA